MQTIPDTERGDVLIFVSGVFEIETVADALAAHAFQSRKWIVLPLHSGLAIEEQDKVFATAPPGMRKAIVSTNIAGMRSDVPICSRSARTTGE